MLVPSFLFWSIASIPIPIILLKRENNDTTKLVGKIRLSRKDNASTEKKWLDTVDSRFSVTLRGKVDGSILIYFKASIYIYI